MTDFAKTLDKPSNEKVAADEGVYYLVSPEGYYAQAFGHDEDATAIAHAVSCTSPLAICVQQLCALSLQLDSLCFVQQQLLRLAFSVQVGSKRVIICVRMTALL